MGRLAYFNNGIGAHCKKLGKYVIICKYGHLCKKNVAHFLSMPIHSINLRLAGRPTMKFLKLELTFRKNMLKYTHRECLLKNHTHAT